MHTPKQPLSLRKKSSSFLPARCPGPCLIEVKEAPDVPREDPRLCTMQLPRPGQNKLQSGSPSRLARLAYEVPWVSQLRTSSQHHISHFVGIRGPGVPLSSGPMSTWRPSGSRGGRSSFWQSLWVLALPTRQWASPSSVPTMGKLSTALPWSHLSPFP